MLKGHAMATLQRSEKKQRLVRVIVKVPRSRSLFCFQVWEFFLHKTIGDMRARTHTHKTFFWQYFNCQRCKKILTELDDFWSSCSHGGHGGLRTESEHLRRWCDQRSSHANKYHSPIEDDALWKESWRSKRALKSSKWKSWSVEHWYIMILRHSRLQGCWMLILKWLLIYSRNQVKAATKEAIYARGLCPSEHPCLCGGNFRKSFPDIAIRWSGWKSLSLWWSLGKVPLQGAVLWQALLFQGLWRPLGTVPIAKVASSLSRALLYQWLC